MKFPMTEVIAVRRLSWEREQDIAFRNRTHVADAIAYALLKRELASRFDNDREGYNQAKSEFVQRILKTRDRSIDVWLAIVDDNRC